MKTFLVFAYGDWARVSNVPNVVVAIEKWVNSKEGTFKLVGGVPQRRQPDDIDMIAEEDFLYDFRNPNLEYSKSGL
jgi:hypothetical protein